MVLLGTCLYTHVFEHLFSIILGMYLRAELLGHMVINFLRNHHILFSTVTAPFLHIVKWWLLSPIQHQQESPFEGAVKKETLLSANSSVMIQHGCETASQCDSSIVKQHGYKLAQLWGGPGARTFSRSTALPSAGLRHSTSALVCFGETASMGLSPAMKHRESALLS